MIFLECIREKSSSYMIQGFSGDTRRNETPWKVRAMGGGIIENEFKK
jgi:hypothetical protein